MIRTILGVWIAVTAAVGSTQDCLQRIGRLDLSPQIPHSIAVDGARALIVGSGVVRVVDLSFPDDPTLIGIFDPDGWAPGPADLAGNHAYVCDAGNDVVHILDLSDPQQIFEVGLIDGPGHIRAVEVIPPYAYVGGTDLVVFDTSDPSAPVALGSFWFLDGAVDLTVELPYVYVAAWWDGLVIIDASDPHNLASVGGALFHTDDWAWVEASDSWVYLPGSETIHLVDARHPENPVYEGAPFRGGASSFDVRAGTALVSRPYPSRIEQFDVAIPTAPISLGAVPVSRWDAPVALFGDYGLVAGEESYLDVVSLCDTPGLDHDAWLEIAAHNNGLMGSSWRTDLVLRNTSTDPAALWLILHTENGEHVLTDSLDGGSQRAFEDIVGLMQATGKGALEIRSTEPVAALARIYDVDDQGTFGQILQGHPGETGLREGESAWLHGLRQQVGRYRSNISIANTSRSSALVTIALFDATGRSLAEYELPRIRSQWVIHEVEPLVNRAGRPDIGWAMARVTVTEGKGVLVSASVIDSRTNDPSTIPMWRAEPSD